MKKWKKIVISLISILLLICVIGISGYSIFINRKVKSADFSTLKDCENTALQATILDNDSKESSKITDGKWITGITIHDGDSIYVKYSEPTTADTIILQETLNKPGSLAYALEGGTKQFSIYASLGGEETLIYRNDKIDSYRMCVFPETTFDSLRIQFDSCRGSAKINEISIYNVEEKTQDFRINDYFCYDFSDYSKNEKFLNYLDGITDLTLFIGAGIDENGNITYSEGFEERLNDVKTAIGDRDIKLYCNIFSNDTEAEFFEKNSKSIAKSAVEFTTKFDLDGVDLDWEYPSGSRDWDAYNQLALDLHEELSKADKKFSFATAVWNMRFSDEAKEAVDYFNIMIYDHVSDDYNGYHSTFKETTLAIERLIYQGYDMSKISLGIPYYGRNLNNSDIGNYWIDYKDSNITDPWTNANIGTYINRETDETDERIAYFNGYAMVRDKVAYAVSMNVGGIMTWNMMSDMPSENELCLHNAVIEACDQRLTETE